jgi:chemotaxis protein MotA
VSFMVASVLMGGGSMGAFIDAPSIIVTIGGSLATVMIMFPIKTFLGFPKVIKRAFLYRVPNTQELAELLISLTESARRDGLLSLERRLADIDNAFLVSGLQMAVDGAPPELIESVLRTEMETSYNRSKQGKALVDQLGRMAPAFGMIGTLLGLVLMLGNLSDPNSLGPGMAVALITTLYGAVMANVMCIPFSEKLAYINQQELLAMEVTIRGVLSIRDGDSPRHVEQKLSAFGLKRAA